MTIRSPLAFLGLALVLACGGGSGGGGDTGASYTPPPGPPANTVWVGGSGGYGGGTTAFDPATLTVPAGTTVTFSFQGGTHTVTSYTLTTDATSKTFTSIPSASSGDHPVQFPTAGTYYYYCTYHGNFFGTFPNATQEATGMAGKIVVQ
ncbi:MAG TPA: hypothetical protein VFT46_10005 [Holophagaceae bacterium]|nr:hypothetical protein [Holophagaceae bacterium]